MLYSVFELPTMKCALRAQWCASVIVLAFFAQAVLADEPAGPVKKGTPDTTAKQPAETTNQQPSTPEPAAAEKVPPVDQQLERTADGKIRFSFQGQPWLDVLQWLAKSSKLTLDWQELPEDKLNLSTQNSYTLEEARDLLNMHLAARGFTLLRRGEVLALIKLEKLNPALVPRVEQGELASRDPHEIVRVSFPLDWLVAEEAVKEFQPMLSPFGKLTAMTATNRLEAMDTVANLREVRGILTREQSSHGESRLVVEFKLKHVHAEAIIEKLRELVGADNAARAPGSARRGADRARMMAQWVRMREEAAKNQGQNQAAKPAHAEPEVHLVVNEQENSILANAPPDKLAIVRQAVQALDVPSAAGDKDNEALTRMRIYRTKSVDPDSIAEMIGNLIEMGKLESTTQVQADDNSNTVIVYATPADHLAIANLVSQIDEDGRDVRIITLHDLEPTYALQAVKLLLQGPGGRRSRSGDEFRIEADTERSRLLLWANDTEYTQVKTALAKLGEQEGTATSGGNLRIMNIPGRGSEQALESLKRIWPHLRANPLRIQNLGKSQSPKSGRGTQSSSGHIEHVAPSTNRTAAVDTSKGRKEPKSPGLGRAIVPAAIALATAEAAEVEATDANESTEDETEDLIDDEEDDASEASSAGESQVPAKSDAADDTSKQDAKSSSEAENEVRTARAVDNSRVAATRPADITITEGLDGQLIITSKDAEAMDAAQKLIEQMLPPQADYEVFHLEYASPLAIELTLRQVFKLDKPTTTSSPGNGLPTTTKPQLQFVSNVNTGTLLVQGATADELQKIRELIELYDQPETLASYEVFHLEHASPFAVELKLLDVFKPEGRTGSAAASNLATAAKSQVQFISDVDSGTLLVQGATAEQLDKIRELIKLYDKPESLDADLQRQTEIYEVLYSRADAVAEVVKEVYRDLLSANDKTFTRERKDGEGRSSGMGYGANYASRIPQFKGLLSIGVEEKSNTLVVSAPVYLIKDVMKLIREVDERAANQKVKVVQLNGVGTDTLRGLLSQIPGVTTNVTPAGTGAQTGAAATAGPTSPQPASQPGTSSPPSAQFRRFDRSRGGGPDSSRGNGNFRRGLRG